MALRQRQWVIYTRPFYENPSNKNKVFYDKKPKVANSDVGIQGTGVVELTTLTISGGATLNTPALDDGGWVVSFRSYSISEVKNAYKELLKTFPSDYIRITEEIPFDTMITPIS
jgi:hypothetical protein